MSYIDTLAKLGPAVAERRITPADAAQQLAQVAEVTETGALDLLRRWDEVVAHARNPLGTCSVCHRGHTGACRRAG